MSLLPELDQTIKADREGHFVLLFFILIVIFLGVSNVMLMAVMERTKEYGVLLALGTTRLKIFGLILSESFWLTLLGTGAGVLVGVTLAELIEPYGIPMGSMSFSYGGVVLDHLYILNTFRGSVIFPLAVFGCGLIAAIPPALRACRLQPVEALRQR